MLIPRYTAFDSHDGPVVMLTCQGFAGLPTPCARLFSKELHLEAEMATYQKPSQTRCSRGLLSHRPQQHLRVHEADGDARLLEQSESLRLVSDSCSERARLCIQKATLRSAARRL
jgi:hypothetical protein